ncbi:thermonuclease family protein [Desulfocurvibacter africanus]|uniref:thermonuclease family protein n=1 Tax=Desulfocurvibacter africanus TaxID=873 RepID=UPI0004175D5E|nr:thermonuclease family protein [Desulfocurvibacter africanus]
MRNLILIILILALQACTPTVQPDLPAGAWVGIVDQVYDGDTLTVIDPERGRVRVRLYGVDCPELRQAGGIQARDTARRLLLQKSVIVQTIDVDRYGRNVARVRVQDSDVSEALVKAGHAWVYGRYCRIEACRSWADLQEQAQGQGLGLWTDPAPIAPWAWRKSKH